MNSGALADNDSHGKDSWSLDNSIKFYIALTSITDFNNGVLTIKRLFFNSREIEILNNVELDHILYVPNVPYNSIEAESVWALMYQNRPASGHAYYDMYTKLRELQNAAGGVCGISEVNQKHRDAVESIALRFKTLYETGSLGAVIEPAFNCSGVSAINGQYVPKIASKENLGIVKAMLKYVMHNDLFCDNINPQAPLVGMKAQTKISLSKFSSIEMWMWTMVCRHGMEMVKYLNACISKLLNAYIRESSNLDAEDYSCLVFNSGIPRGYYAKFLKKILEEIYLEPTSNSVAPQPIIAKPVIPIHIETQTSSSKVADALASLFDGEESSKSNTTLPVSPICIGSSYTMPTIGTALSELGTDTSEILISKKLQPIQPSLPTMTRLKRTQSTPTWPSEKQSIA